MDHWTTGQWAVFALVLAGGAAAFALAWLARSAVLGWTAPAPMRRTDPDATPRPTLMLAERRAALPPVRVLSVQHPPIEPSRLVPVVVGDSPTALHDPMTADYSTGGVGSLRALLTAEPDPALRTSAEIAAAEDAWINAYADLSHSMPETDAEHERMRVALEPAMRTARLWLVRAGEGGAGRRGLTDWRMNTPTGEYPSPFAVTPRNVAHALLVS